MMTQEIEKTDAREDGMKAPAAHLIGGLARRGAAWSALLLVARNGLSLGTTAVLARLLSPTDFGLIGMVATLTVFLQVFQEMGLSEAVVQRADLTRKQVDNLFWVNAAIGLLLWGGAAAAGPELCRFYHRPELGALAVWMGFTFVPATLAVQPMALMKRQMLFKRLSLIETASNIFAAAVGIVMAVMRYGYWALVGQALALQAARLVLFFATSRYRPGRPRRGAGTAGLLTFGGFMAAYGLVNYFARNLDNVMVGKAWGAAQLGFYSRAYFLMTLPTMLATSALADVMIPSLSVLRSEPARMGNAYRKAVRMIAFVGCPLAVGLAVCAPEAVRLVYGPKWMPIVPMLVWLSLASVTQPIHNTMGWLYVVSGKSRQMFQWGIFASIVLAVGFRAGLPWGGTGVAAAYALLMTFVLTLPALYFAHRAAGLNLAQSLAPVVPILLCAGGMGVATFGLGRWLSHAGAGWQLRLVTEAFFGAVLYTMMALAWVRPVPFGFLEKLRPSLSK